MTKEQFARAMSLFDSVCKMRAQLRESFLDAECHDDNEVRRSVEAMLAHDCRTGREDDPLVGAGAALIESVVRSSGEAPVGSDLPGAAWIGRSVGRYRILRVLGAGGMGTVFESQQDHPTRRVALKVLSATLYSAELLRRFQFETEVLARLQHPNVAQIYDAGTLDGKLTGRPFFAMELVDGEPVTVYANRHALSIENRLELFVKVCRAVELHRLGIGRVSDRAADGSRVASSGQVGERGSRDVFRVERPFADRPARAREGESQEKRGGRENQARSA